MRPVLFYDIRSPPVRSCLMLIKKLGVDVELKEIDLFKREHLSEDFIKVNPAHTVPTLKDGELTLTDSHAILIYLANKYAPGDSKLYPKDETARIRIINRLFFECGILFRRDSDMMSEIFRTGKRDVQHHKAKIHESYGILEEYLKETKNIVSDEITIADFSIVTTISTTDIIFPVTVDKWPRLTAWLTTMKTFQYYKEANEAGLELLKKALRDYAKFDL